MTDYTFFSALTHCIRQGGAPVLCTIVDSAGSAPRGAGARMALLSDGTWIGTVSGGAVENLVQQRASAVMDGTARAAWSTTPWGARPAGPAWYAAER